MNTSLQYNVEYTLLDPLPEVIVQNEPLLVGLRLRNTGLTPWLIHGYPVMVVARWLTTTGQIIHEFPWHRLTRPVPVGETIDVELRIDQTPPPGAYVLTIELVEYGVAWFRDRGVPPFSHQLRIEVPRGPRITVINGNCIANDAVGSHVATQIRALAEAGFQPLLLTEFVDDRIPRSLRRFMVNVNLSDILHPGDQTRRFADHFYSSAVVIVNYSTYYNLVELIRYAQSPVLFDYHGVTPPAIWGVGQPGYDNLVLGVTHLNLVKYADYAIAHSRYTTNELLATNLIAPSRVEQFPYAVVRNASYMELVDQQLQDQYGLAGKRVLLYVGRMARNKRVHVLVEALPLIHRHYPETVLLLVGDTGHVYAGYVNEVKAKAAELGVADSVIFTGFQNRPITDFYQLAEIVVTASIHEGFCMPVIEAMAAGKPVIAAATTALPETVGGAGLLFSPDNVEDLAQKVIQVLQSNELTPSGVSTAISEAIHLEQFKDRPIAFVTPRYGPSILGGAEQGAQLWAEQLVARGLRVEVLTTNVIDIANWQTDDLPATEMINGVLVRRFTAEPLSHGFHEVQVKAARGERVTRSDEEYFMSHNLRSRDLEAYIAEHREEYAAFIFTPYLFGTTYYGAQKAGDRAFHIPCLHDEPAARFSLFREMLEEARGIFFNSSSEERLAREKLSLANPHTAVLGYGFPAQPVVGNPSRFRERTGIDAPFLLYSGRLEGAKNVPLLIEWFVHYKESRPDSKLMLVMTGRGELPVPQRPDIVNLGVVDRQDLADVFASCLALCQLSTNESFSIVMMEAWQQRRPVIVHADCVVTREHIERSGGGYACCDVDSFSAVVDSLLHDPDKAMVLGNQGYTYVQTNYTWDVLVDTFIQKLAVLLQPRSLLKTLAQRGIRRALEFTYERFEARFTGLIRHISAQYPDWRLFEAVQNELLRLEKSELCLDRDISSVRKPSIPFFTARGQQSQRCSDDQHQINTSLVQLVDNLFELLVQTKRYQRQLERELVKLQDQLLSLRDKT
ncbi:MAG: glycosyltransferase family 4 protein [Chloroflexus sp.]|uniref:glycosyltransferase family 4 protein n=1 Tax=Chloroflexus sp. TaxID=1904827 RepID=UPI0030A4C7B9